MYASLIDLLDTWPLSARHESDQDQIFLQRNIFAGLADLNNGFDSPAIQHFSPSDFLMVIDRCARHGVEIIGIEAFAEAKQLLEVGISTEPGYEWARRFASRYLSNGGVTLCASYELKVLKAR